MLSWRLAFRNLLRHRGRLALNLILLVGAFCTIVCFKGFKNYILVTIKNSIIDNQFGHIEIARRSFWENTPVDQASERMISAATDWVKKISQLDGVQFVSPRVSFYGIVNTQKLSTTAHFVGIQPDVETNLQKSFALLEGQEFNEPKQSLMSTGLQTKLKIKSHDDITLVALTLAGGLNAIDLVVSGIFSSGFSEMDSGTLFLNLKDAGKILDSDDVDQLLITLKDESDSPRIMTQIKELLKGTDLQPKTWREQADLFNQVENFYTFQNIFIEVIILLLLFLSVSNTVSMTVFERLNEIGTLRALGDYESSIQRLFLIESFLLGLLAVTIGIPCAFLVIYIVASLNILITLPMATQPILFTFIPTWGSFLEAGLACIIAVVIASLWPARNGARTAIVTALGAKL